MPQDVHHDQLQELEPDRREQSTAPHRLPGQVRLGQQLVHHEEQHGAGRHTEGRPDEPQQGAPGRAVADPDPVQDRVGETAHDTRDADRHDHHEPHDTEHNQVESLADHEAALLLLRDLERVLERLTQTRQPPESGVEQQGQADQTRLDLGALDLVEADLAGRRVVGDDPRKELLDGRGEVLARVGEDARDIADHGEAEGQDREEREEAEVGDRSGENVALHLGVVLKRRQQVVEDGVSRP